MTPTQNPLLTGSAARSTVAYRRIAGQIYKTPLLPSKTIGARYGADLFFKAENFQLTGSFKIRGASSKISSMEGDARLITASSGNHGIAASLAAQNYGRELTVVVPETVAKAKLAKIESFGTTVIQHGSEPGAAEVHARALAGEEDGLEYMSPYNDADVIAGQGTVAIELLSQHDSIDNVFVAMGGGGLISGIGAVMKSFSPHTRIIGVAAENTAALAASMVAGTVVETEHRKTLADGVAGGVDEGSLTLPMSMAAVDEVVYCDEDEIARSLRGLALEEHQLVEGAAALALAGFEQIASRLSGEVSVVVLCGSNYDDAVVLPLIG